MRKWNAIDLIGYEPKTTIWEDLEAAESFGREAVRDTVFTFYSAWKDNVEFVTELVMAVNHLSWYWNEKDDTWMNFYADLYYELDEEAITYMEKKEDKEGLRYYFRTLD